LELFSVGHMHKFNIETEADFYIGWFMQALGLGPSYKFLILDTFKQINYSKQILIKNRIYKK